MINILVSRNRQGNICRLKVKGHAGFDEAGKDIVCGAVSAIVQTAVLGLKNVAKIQPIYYQKKGIANLEMPLDLTKDEIKETDIILETTLLGLKSMELGYGEYITVQERKVE